MVGLSILAVLDYFEILQDVKSNGLCLDLDAACLKMGDKKLRSLFDQVLRCFLKGVSVSEVIRPLPVVLGDGRSVDLYDLFMVVKGKGGYDLVSKNGWWKSVAEEIGLDSGVVSTVKLYYFKYLHPLDRWLHVLFKNDRRRGGSLAELGLLPSELEKELKSLLNRIKEPIQIGSEASDQMSGDDQHSMNGVTSVEKLSGGDEKCGGNDKDGRILEPSVVDGSANSRKRKRENVYGMLNWLLEIARKPCDEAMGKFEEHKAKGGQDFLGLAMVARDALSQRQNGNSSGGSSLSQPQKKQKMHPAMYEDEGSVDQQSTERSRSRQRLSDKDSQMHHGSFDKDANATPFSAEKENNEALTDSDSEAKEVADPFEDGPLRIPVRVGRRYQAEIPEWTGKTPEDDSKWLGTVHWRRRTESQELVTQMESIGKGRQYSCDCRARGSVECVRFHIAENKMRLKLELGSVFFHWRFHCMGEEVSLTWTKEEENKFKSIVRQNRPSQNKNFWKQVGRFFHTKSKQTLASYYFNVFVLRRRIYQNRVTPHNIDSDDDESEFGSVSNDFGHEAVRVPDSRSIVCSQNYQCMDLD